MTFNGLIDYLLGNSIDDQHKKDVILSLIHYATEKDESEEELIQALLSSDELPLFIKTIADFSFKMDIVRKSVARVRLENNELKTTLPFYYDEIFTKMRVITYQNKP
jgi:hypothetical protein